MHTKTFIIKQLSIKPAVVILFLIMAAFTFYEDISERTGLPENIIQTYILSNLAGDFDNNIENPVPREDDAFRIPVTHMLPSIISGDKVAVAKDICSYIKLYCNSQKFTDDYNFRRESALPLYYDNISAASIKQSIKVHETNIKNYPNSTSYITDEQKLLDADNARLNALFEKAKQPFPLKDAWKKMYPADAAILVKQRLQEYIALAATVDFNAQLAAPDKYNKRKFINPAYEKKSLQWKAIYRAGKDVNDVVTAFVKEWLKGDIISKEKTVLPGEKNTKTSSNNYNITANEKATNNTTAASNINTPDTTNKKTNTTTEPAVLQVEKNKKLMFNKLKDKVKKVTDK